jgi:hypothetical protein
MSIKFKKNMAGQVFVLYECESCGSPLKSNVDEIGSVDDCPTCGALVLYSVVGNDLS